MVRYNQADRDSFIAKINENPAESTTHGVYADWLDEQGHADEARRHRAISEWLKNPRVYTVSQHGSRGGYSLWGSSEYIASQLKNGSWVWKKNRNFNDTVSGNRPSMKTLRRAEGRAAAEGIPYLPGVRHGQPVQWDAVKQHPVFERSAESPTAEQY